MDGQTKESLSSGWLTPEALVEFIDELRRNGFNIGVADYIAAQDLLLMLAARGEKLENPRRAVSLLGPLLCSSPDEQESFSEFFRRWHERRLAKLGGQKAPDEETMAEALDDTAKSGLRWEWMLFAVGVIILSGTAWYLVQNFLRTEVRLPEPVLVAPDTSSDLAPLIQLATVAIGLLILAYVAWWGWWRHLANQFLQRRQSEGTPDIKQVSLIASDEALFPSLTFLSLTRLFRRRIPVVSRDLNVVKTVEESVEQGGWLRPIYDHVLIPPEYLVLVDRRSRFDHLAEFVEGMVKRLELNGVFITAYAFDGDPRLCFPLNGKGAPQTLNELAARYENMRLIVFAEAQGLLNPVSGRLPPWSRLFNRWVHRSVLTPESPASWGAAEHELQREFIVLPGTTDGLAALMGIVQGQLKMGEINTWADSTIPGTLQERPQRWIERDSPAAAEIDSVLEELRRYLGDEGYTWFESCAVYPELQWQITITLGQLLKDGEGQPLLHPKRMIDLARLPWFRYGLMPDWLRTRLILDLAPNREEEIRTALEALLVTAVQGHGEALDLEIAHQRREWTSQLVRPLLRLLGRKAPSDSPVQDHVFLDFMFQHLNLAVRVPAALRRQLFTYTGIDIGWKILLQWTGVNILIAILLSIVEGIFLVTIGTGTDTNLLPAISIGVLQGVILGLLQWRFLRRFWRFNGWLWILSSILVTVLVWWVRRISSEPGISINLFSYSIYGLFSLSLLGIFQAGIMSRWKIQRTRLWLIATVVSGVINSFVSLLIMFAPEPSDWTLYTLYPLTFLINIVVYSSVTGWFFLSLLHKRPVSTTWLLRPIWILMNPVGLGLSILVALFPLLLFPYLNAYVGLFLAIVISALMLSLTQALILRIYSLGRVRLWFLSTFAAILIWLASFTFAVSRFYDFSSFMNNLFSTENVIPMILVSLFLGIATGLGQCYAWYRYQLRPFMILIWLLCTTIAWSLMFLEIPFLLTIPANFSPKSIDQVGILILVIGISYSMVTSLPLVTLAREALQHQDPSKDSASYTGSPLYSPLMIISKIRNRVSSTRAPS